jgi:uncharacterized damage-inducible protein DinB
MTTAGILLEDFDMEMAMTRRILAAVPDDCPNFKPHEKSMPLGRLAVHIATLPRLGINVLTSPGMDLATATWPTLTFVSRDELLSDFDTLAAEARTTLANSSDADLEHIWKFNYGDRVLSANTRSCTFRHMFFSHMIHHRAQLGVYLRLNNLPVPGIYGPSADEPFTP